MQVGNLVLPEAVAKAMAAQFGQGGLPGLGAVTRCSQPDAEGFELPPRRKTITLADAIAKAKTGPRMTQKERKRSGFTVLAATDDDDENDGPQRSPGLA